LFLSGNPHFQKVQAFVHPPGWHLRRSGALLHPQAPAGALGWVSYVYDLGTSSETPIQRSFSYSSDPLRFWQEKGFTSGDIVEDNDEAYDMEVEMLRTTPVYGSRDTGGGPAGRSNLSPAHCVAGFSLLSCAVLLLILLIFLAAVLRTMSRRKSDASSKS
jgi:hypothetical protein